MKKLTMNTLLAKTKLAHSRFNQMVNDYTLFFKTKQGAFKGIKKTHLPKEGFMADPNYLEVRQVVTTVDEKLDWFNSQLKDYLKDELTVEATNSSGAQTIELVVDGISFGFLTALELMRLKSAFLEEKSVKTMYQNIPVREDSLVWKKTSNSEYSDREIFETPLEEGQTRTTEKEEVIIKDPNLDPQHLPSNYNAKTTLKTKMVVTGDYTRQNFSGEWNHHQRAELQKRYSKLIEAIEVALKNLNATETVETHLDVDGFVNYLTYGKK